MDGMVHLSAVRSKYPRARVLKIHASKAEALPGVLGVLTAKMCQIIKWDIFSRTGML